MASTYNPSLVTRLDYARSLIGDTDVTVVNTAQPYVLIPDETYNAAFLKLGWIGGLVFLLDSLITQFGQQPLTFAQANGVTYNMGERIPAWRSLKLDALNGNIPDPDNPGTPGLLRTSGTSACNIPTW